MQPDSTQSLSINCEVLSFESADIAARHGRSLLADGTIFSRFYRTHSGMGKADSTGIGKGSIVQGSYATHLRVVSGALTNGGQTFARYDRSLRHILSFLLQAQGDLPCFSGRQAC